MSWELLVLSFDIKLLFYSEREPIPQAAASVPGRASPDHGIICTKFHTTSTPTQSMGPCSDQSQALTSAPAFHPQQREVRIKASSYCSFFFNNFVIIFDYHSRLAVASSYFQV
jgi:hypothetical protein